MNKLRLEFLAFHRDNPWVYDKLIAYCGRLHSAGWQHYSMRTIISVIRFDRDLETGGEDVTVEGGDVVRVKINDHHSPYYARLAAYHNPPLRLFFEYRRVDGERRGEPILFSDRIGDPDIYLDGTPVTAQLSLVM